MKIPKKICAILEDKKNFDYLFLEKLTDNQPIDAYSEAMSEVKKYAPRFKLYKDYDAYRSTLVKDKRYANHKDGDFLEVPKDVVYAVSVDIEQLMDKNVQKHKLRKVAYDKTVLEIQKYFPTFKPFSNYQTYKTIRSIRHKNKRKRNRGTKGV